MDILATLGADAGVARSCVLMEPTDSPLWTVAIDVGLEQARAGTARADPRARPDPSAGGPTFDLVGACGWTRSDTLVRGAGEAVERFALIAPACDPLVVGAVAPDHPRRVALGTPTVALAASALDEAVVDCVAAFEVVGGRATGGETVLVPASVVSDPAHGVPVDWIDPSPSGVAAGPSWAFAASRALLESIERDAVGTAWPARPDVPIVDPAEMPPGLGRGDGRHAQKLRDFLLGSPSISARSLLLPTGLEDVYCALTVLIDHDAGPDVALAAGSSAGASLAGVVHGSAREAVQVLSALRRLAARHDGPRDGPVVGESSRALYCTTRRPADWWESWVERCTPLRFDVATNARVSGEAPAVTLPALAGQLVDQGLRPLVVDLTPRLPDRVRMQGWRAARALVLGHQPLRMDERCAWKWIPGRLERWGTGSAAALARCAPPHPLI